MPLVRICAGGGQQMAVPTATEVGDSFSSNPQTALPTSSDWVVGFFGQRCGVRCQSRLR